MHKLRTHFVTLANTNATLSFESWRNLCLTTYLVFWLLQMLLQSLCFNRSRSILTIAIVFCARQPLTLNKLSLDLYIVQMVTFLHFHVSLLFFLKYVGDGKIRVFKVLELILKDILHAAFFRRFIGNPLYLTHISRTYCRMIGFH